VQNPDRLEVIEIVTFSDHDHRTYRWAHEVFAAEESSE